MAKQELVSKLRNIWNLYVKTQNIQSEMDDFEPEDLYERKVVVPEFPGNFRSEEELEIWRDQVDHTDEGAPQIIKNVHRRFYGPKEPEKPVEQEFVRVKDDKLQSDESKFGCLSKILAGVAVFFFLGMLLNLEDEALPTMIIIALIGALGFVGFGYMAKRATAALDKKNAEALAIHNRQQEDRMAEYAQKMKAYEADCQKYEAGLEKFMKDYLAWRKIYIQSVEEEEEIEAQLESDRQAAVDRIYQEQMVPAETALNDANDLVSDDYLPVLDEILDLIQSGRADDLKEAINLYEEIVYRERQLALEQEKENQRQWEEAQRRQDEERHHQEQMQFQKEQERQRKYEAEKELKLREKQHSDEMRMQEARLKQEAEQAKASRQKRCVLCAHTLTCRQQYYDGAYNCPGFTPKK